MAFNMKSDFLGKSLSTGVSARKPVSQMQVQALFGLGGSKKKAEKTAKTGTQKTGGIVKQAQRALKQVHSFLAFCWPLTVASLVDEPCRQSMLLEIANSFTWDSNLSCRAFLGHCV